MLKQKTITVESVDYLLTTIPAIKALQLQPKVMKLLGRSIAVFFESASTMQEGSTELEAQVLQRIAEVFLEDLDKIDINELVRNTKGYSGADVEGVIKESIETVFADGKTELTTSDILKAIKNTHSLSEIMKEPLERMSREYENRKFKNASR